MASRQIVRQHWEGIFAADFTLDGVERRCRQLGDVLRSKRWSCLVAHDTRFMASQFARYAFLALEAQGVAVTFCPTPVPFPAVELALEQRRADTVLLMTAGNRPFWYCGMTTLSPPVDWPPLQDTPPPSATDPQILFPPSMLDNTDQTQVDLRKPYLEALRNAADIDAIRRATLTVFVDPMNGTTSGYLPAAIGEGGQTKAIEINRETDPLFGRQVPQPSEAGLNRLRKLVKESDSHLGVALSADGRAISVADNNGDILAPLDLAQLLAYHLNRQYRQRGLIVAPLPADGASEPTGLRNWEDASGLKVELAADPATRIAELLAQDRNSLLVGVTPNGEVTLGRYGASPDASLAALVLIEIAAHQGKRLRALLEEAKKT